MLTGGYSTCDYMLDDIYALPDGERAELIDGQIYYMAPPSRKSQKITGRIYKEITNHISRKDGPCEVYAAPFAVFLNKDDANYVEPDVSVICNPDKLDDRGCNLIFSLAFQGSSASGTSSWYGAIFKACARLQSTSREQGVT